MAGQTAGSLGNPARNILNGSTADQHGEGFWHGMTTIQDCSQPFGGGIHQMDYGGGGGYISRMAAREGPVPGWQGGFGERVPTYTPSDTDQTGKGTPLGGFPASVSGVKNLISPDVWDSGVPGRGLQRGGGGGYYGQTPGTLFTPPCLGFSSNNVGEKKSSPPLKLLKHVRPLDSAEL